MFQKIRVSGYQIIRFLTLFFVFSSLVHRPSLLAQEVPRFYGEEVVVTTSRLPQLASKSPWDTTVITTQELKNFRTVGEALRIVAGVDSIAYGYLGSTNSIRLRGANASQVLILVDGRRINSPTLGMFDMGDLLTDDVEKIEVVRAPLSAIYGSDAVSGVINIITKSPKETERSFSVSAGSFGTQQYKVFIGSENYLIVADYLKSDGFRTNSDYLAKDVFCKLIFPSSFGQLLVDGSYYDAIKGVPGLPTSEADPASASTPNDRQFDKNSMLGIGLKGNAYNLRAYQSIYDQKYNWEFFGTTGTSTNQAYRTGIEWQQNFDLVIGKFLYGLEAREDRGKTSGYSEQIIRNYAAFVQDEAQLGKQCSLVASIRGDKHSTAGTSFNPRVGIVYQPQGNLIIRASAGSSFRAPGLNDLYWNDGVMFGNPSLKPERAVSYDIGLERSFSENSWARVNYFLSTTNDLILWPQVATYEYRAVNMGVVRNEGVEFELVRRLGENGKGFINFTYQKALIKEGVDPSMVGGTVVDKITPFTPQSKLNVGVILENGSLLVRSVGERFVDLQNTLKLPGYTVVDLTLGKKMGNWRVDFAVNNLFDEIYFEAASKIPGTTTALKYPMPGRRYTLGMQWKI